MTSHVFGMGSNLFSQLGTAESDSLVIPTPLEGVKSVLACSFSQTIVRDERGDIITLGLPLDPPLPSKMEHLPRLVGHDALVRLERDYRAYAMDGRGRVLLAQDDSLNLYPCIEDVISSQNGEKIELDVKERIQSITGGAGHFLLLTTPNTLVYSYGDNRYGQCGHSSTSSNTLNHLDFFEGLGVAQIIAGDFHSIVRTRDGSLYAFGSDKDGQLTGFGGNEPCLIEFGDGTEVADEPDFVDVACGATHTVALDSKGQVWVTGSNHSGQLGLGDKEDRKVFERLKFEKGPVKSIFASKWSTLLVT